VTGSGTSHPPTLAEHLRAPEGGGHSPLGREIAGAEDAGRPEGRIHLLYEAAPLALVAEAAGGRASTGRARVLDVVAARYDQRTPCYIGSAEEVGWAGSCVRDADR
jgi:hypothetical protein